jgi:hypothetical protein
VDRLGELGELVFELRHKGIPNPLTFQVVAATLRDFRGGKMAAARVTNDLSSHWNLDC